MVDQSFRQISKKTWYRWSFYINIVLFFIIALSVLFLILDSYEAGQISVSRSGSDALSQQWLYIVRDIAFLTISIALIFFQFFRNLLVIIRRSL
jgi:Fe2+ transport system protein B